MPTLWDTQIRHAEYYSKITVSGNQKIHLLGNHTQDGINIFERDWDNIFQALNWGGENARKSKRALELFEIMYENTISYLQLVKHPNYLINLSKTYETIGGLSQKAKLLIRLCCGIGYQKLGLYQMALNYFETLIKNTILSPETTGHIHNYIAVCYKNLSNPTSARKNFEEVQKIAIASENKYLEGLATIGLGSIEHDLGNFDKALEINNRANDLLNKINDHQVQSLISGNIGAALLEKGEYKKARFYLNKQLKIALKHKDRRGEGVVYENIATIFSRENNKKDAEVYFKKALSAFESIGDIRLQQQILSSQAVLLIEDNKISEALNLNNQAYKLALESGYKFGEANALSVYGKIYLKKGEINNAISSYQNALNIYKAENKLDGMGKVLVGLGLAYKEAGNKRKALEHIDEAIGIYSTNNTLKYRKQLKELRDEISNYDPSKSIEFSKKQLIASKKTDNYEDQIEQMLYIGTAYYAKGEFRLARYYFEESNKLATVHNMHRQKGLSLLKLSSINLAFGKVHDTLEQIYKAKLIFEEIKDFISLGHAEAIIANAYYAIGKGTLVLEHAKKAQKLIGDILDAEIKLELMKALGHGNYVLSKYKIAYEHYEALLIYSREVGNIYAESLALGFVGLLQLKTGKLQNGIETGKEARVLCKKINNLAGESQALGLLAGAHNALREYEKSIEYSRERLKISKIMTDVRSKAQAYGDISTSYMLMGKYAEALENAHMWKDLLNKAGDIRGESKALAQLGHIYILKNKLETGNEYFTRAIRLCKENKIPIPPEVRSSRYIAARSFVKGYFKYHKK